MVPETEEVSDGIIEPGEELRVQSIASSARFRRVDRAHHDTMLTKRAQLVGDSGSRDPELERDDVADLAGTMVADGQHLDDAAAHRVGEDLERMDHATRLRRCRAAARRPSTGAGERYQLIGSALPSS